MIRPISIEAVSNGWIVRVGCQQIVFLSVPELTTHLGKYLTNPDETEKSFVASAVNIKHTLNGNPVPVNETAYATGEPGYPQNNDAPRDPYQTQGLGNMSRNNR